VENDGMKLTENDFEQLVVEVLDSLPEDLLNMIDNVDVVIELRPTQEQLASAGISRGSLFGLYEGIPLTMRDSGYSIVAPDKITIFKRVIEQACSSEAEVADQVRTTVIHEVAHHFGIDEEKLDELGWS
jgi:predicted Zn-dependent protease with MMP-like domain